MMTDSGSLTRLLMKMKREDFRPSPLKLPHMDILTDLVHELHRRHSGGQEVMFIHIPAHCGILYNTQADQVAVQAAQSEELAWDYRDPDELEVTFSLNLLAPPLSERVN